MKLIIVKNGFEVGKKAVILVREAIRKKKDAVLGLATGKTMVPLYSELVRMYKSKRINFSNVVSFNLDEYYGVSANDKRSFRSYMNEKLFDKVDIQKNNINFLNGLERNWKKECLDYEKKIRKAGGIDLMILGLGRDGHIAFDEPGSGFKSKTRRVKLQKMTKEDNNVKFNYALTLGLKNIMKSRKILLLVSGKQKRKIFSRFLESGVSENLPATILKKHKNLIIVADREAISR